jgi:hypothetical protein
MPKEPQAERLEKWDVAVVGAEANASEPGFDELRIELGTASTGARISLARRALLLRQLRQTTSELSAFLAAGAEAYSRLRHVVKGRYGLKSEKLAEFGFQARQSQQGIKDKSGAAETKARASF